METFNYLINIVFSSLVTIYFFLVPFGGFLSVFFGANLPNCQLGKTAKIAVSGSAVSGNRIN